MVFQPKDLTLAEMHQEIERLNGLIAEVNDLATNQGISEETAIMQIRDLTTNAFSVVRRQYRPADVEPRTGAGSLD